MSLKTGDLIHVPSETIVYRMDDMGMAHDFYKLLSPQSLLIVDNSNNEFLEEHYYKVFFQEDDDWYVRKQDVYEVKNE